MCASRITARAIWTEALTEEGVVHLITARCNQESLGMPRSTSDFVQASHADTGKPKAGGARVHRLECVICFLEVYFNA